MNDFDRPTLTQLNDRIKADIESGLPSANARLRNHKLRVMGTAVAGASHGLHGHIDYVATQLLPDRNTGHWLLREAAIYGITPHAATAATGTLAVSGTAGEAVPAGTYWQHSSGMQYLATATVPLDSAGQGELPVVAAIAGRDGNASTGEVLRSVKSLPGVTPQATVITLDGGNNAETIEQVRGRYLLRKRQPPRAGAKHDYVAWALAAHPAVTRAWPFPNELGANTVTVRIVTDDAEGGLVPAQTVIDEVQAYIDGVKPITTDVSVLGPIRVVQNYTLSVYPDTSDMRAAVEREIADWLTLVAQPGGLLRLSQLNEVISSVAGEIDHKVIAPTTSTQLSTTGLAVPGIFTWQAWTDE